jgi:hypothetical protein
MKLKSPQRYLTSLIGLFSLAAISLRSLLEIELATNEKEAELAASWEVSEEEVSAPFSNMK